LTEEQILSYQTRGKGTPLWIWITLAAGLVTSVILLVVLAVGR
jgi:hypothetical protein